MESGKGEVCNSGQMDPDTRGTGKTTKRGDLEGSYIRMGTAMKVLGRMDRRKVSVSTSMPTDRNI